MAAGGTNKPIAAALQQHRLEITAVYAIRTANRFASVKRTRVGHRLVDTRGLMREQAPKYAKLLSIKRPRPGGQGRIETKRLEQIPQELVVDLVMKLHLLRFDESSQRPRAAIRGGLL